VLGAGRAPQSAGPFSLSRCAFSHNFLTVSPFAPYLSGVSWYVWTVAKRLIHRLPMNCSRKFAVTISGRARAGVVVKAQIFYPAIIFEGAVATCVARIRCKPLRLATSELPENFRNRS
jgi:hypothetical protein